MSAFCRLLLAVLLLPVSAVARGEDPPAWMEVDSWTIFAASDTACQAITDNGYGTTIAISADTGGGGSFILSDEYLSLTPGDIHPAQISWDDWSHSQDIEFVVVRLNNGAPALRLETGAWFTQNLAQTKRFAIRLPNIDFEQDFPIDNAVAMIDGIQTCNNRL